MVFGRSSYRSWINSISTLPSKEEEEELKAARNKLKHAEQIREGLQKSQSLLTDEGGSIMESLGQVLKELESVQNIDSSLAEPVERSRSAFYELEEVVESLRSYGRSLELNPTRLEEIEDRLAEINELKRKYCAIKKLPEQIFQRYCRFNA